MNNRMKVLEWLFCSNEFLSFCDRTFRINENKYCSHIDFYLGTFLIFDDE
jgi:hypothetical protein